jgi:uncharacterized membrane protein required for colicin V production
VNISQYALLGITLAVFGLLGFRRGVNRELLLMVGIAVAMLLANSIGPALIPVVNQLYRLLRFAVSGGLGGADPTAAWQASKQLPDLVSATRDAQFVVIGVFVLIVLTFYAWGQRRVAEPRSFMSKILGLLAGGINGFLVAYYLFPVLLAQSGAGTSLPSQEISAILTSGQTIALVIVVFMVLLIAFGLYNSTGPRKRD